MSNVTTTDGNIAAYCTDRLGNRCGYIFNRFPFYHVVLWDDRFDDDEVGTRYDTLEEAEFVAYLRQWSFDRLDLQLAELGRIEAEERAQDTVEWWDEMLSFA